MKNPVKKWLDEQRYYGDTHRDRRKYHREAPNRHAFDDEIEEVLNPRDRKEI